MHALANADKIYRDDLIKTVECLVKHGASVMISGPAGGTAMNQLVTGVHDGFVPESLLELVRVREGLCRRCGQRIGSLAKLFGQDGTDHKNCRPVPSNLSIRPGTPR